MIIKADKTIAVAAKLLVAGVVVFAVTLSVFSGSIFAASGDADDDGVGDSDDNCVYVSNADQVDDVSTGRLQFWKKHKTDLANLELEAEMSSDLERMRSILGQ